MVAAKGGGPADASVTGRRAAAARGRLAEPARPRRRAAARGGVPANATFKARPSDVLGEQALAPLAQGGLARLPVRAVQDKDAVEVVYLVLEDPRQQALGLEAELLPGRVLPRDGDRHGALHVYLDPRYREAAFGQNLGLVGAGLYHGVD